MNFIITGVKRKFEEWFSSPHQPPKKRRKILRESMETSDTRSQTTEKHVVEASKDENNTSLSSPPPPKNKKKKKRKVSITKRLGSYFFRNRKTHVIKREIHGKSATQVKDEIFEDLRTSQTRFMKELIPNGSKIMRSENFSISSGLGQFSHQKGGKYVYVYTNSKSEFLLGYNPHEYFTADFERGKVTFSFDVQISKITDEQIFLIHVLYPDMETVFKVTLCTLYKKWSFELVKIRDEDKDDDEEEEQQQPEIIPPPNAGVTNQKIVEPEEEEEEEEPAQSEEQEEEEEEEEEPAQSEEQEEEEEKNEKKIVKKSKKKKKKKKKSQDEKKSDEADEVLFFEDSKDKDLTARKFHHLKVKIREGELSLSCDNRIVFPRRDLFAGMNTESGCGPVKFFFGVKKSACTLRRFVISPVFRDDRQIEV